MDFVKNTEVLVIISQFFISKVNILQSRDTLERTSLMRWVEGKGFVLVVP